MNTYKVTMQANGNTYIAKITAETIEEALMQRITKNSKMMTDVEILGIEKA